MNDPALRQHLLELLRGGSAHLKFDDAIADLPPQLRAHARVARRTRPGGSWNT